MKNPKATIHLIILISLLVGIGFLYFLTEAKLRQVNRLTAEMSLLRENQSRLGTLSSLLPQLRSEKIAWSRTLPESESEIALFAATMEEAARTEGLVITFHFDDFPEDVDVSGQKMRGLETEMVLEGSFQGLTNFLVTLSRSQYFYKIDKITINKHESQVGVKATLNGLVMTNII